MYQKALTGERLVLCVMVLKPNKQQCHEGSCIAVAEETSLDSKKSSKTTGTLLDEGCCHTHAKSYSMTRQKCGKGWNRQRSALAKALVSLNLLPMFPLTLARSGSPLVHFVWSHSLGPLVSTGGGRAITQCYLPAACCHWLKQRRQ